MKCFGSFNRKILSAFYFTSGAILMMALLFVPVFPKKGNREENYFTIYVNGTEVGHTDSVDDARKLMGKARRRLASLEQDMFYSQANLTWEGKHVWFGAVDDPEQILDTMEEILKENEVIVQEQAYTVKINDYMVNLSDSDEVTELLETVLEPYDRSDAFSVCLQTDPDRELNVLTAAVTAQEELINDEPAARVGAGAEQYFAEVFAETEPDIASSSFAELEYGLVALDFADVVEVVECWLPKEKLTSLDEAVAQITVDRKKEKIYEVREGDTLLQIASDHNLTAEELLERNPALEGIETQLRAGDEIKITVPEPVLSVNRTERVYTEGSYEAEVTYLENHDWYSNRQDILQQPSAGIHKAAVLVSRRNDIVTATQIEKEEILIEAVPKIIERGTRIPPTYIRPVTGGKITSNYGGRNAPVKGASTNHKGTDIAVPTGTAVMASSGGKVTRAGWASGYGNVVYITHEDGKETRYAHLSKILVKAGQEVKQGEKIALSGNTGRSSGPHLHFEIRINGEAVNSLDYIQ